MTGLQSALLGVPLAVLGQAAGPYDDPKAWALLIIASATGLAWLIHARIGRGAPSGGPDRRARVLSVIVLACLAWWTLTTVTSIAPLQSLLGSFGRGMGLLTMAAAALTFFLVQSECRTPRVVRSIVDAALLGSVPVSLLALGQAAGWDPLPEAWDPAVRDLRVRSTFGQHIFLGSYLVALIPLTAARLEWALRESREAGRRPAELASRWLPDPAAVLWVAGAVGLVGLGSYWPSARWGLAAWGVVGAAWWGRRRSPAGQPSPDGLGAPLLAGLLAAQALVLILSQARGAFIGMLVGLGILAVTSMVRRRAWKSLSAVALALAALVALVAFLSLSLSAAASLGKVGLLSRLAQITNVGRGSPGWVRVQVWKGILIGWSGQLRGEEVVPGQSPLLRGVLGFGPETQLLVLDRMAGPLLGALPARGQGWHARYVIDRAHNVVLDHLVTAGLGGAALWGLLVGAIVVVGIARIRASVSPGEATMRLGALGAVLGHVAEGQVGIETAMPLALFWLVAGLLTSEPWAAVPLPSVPPPRPVASGQAWRWRIVLALAVLLALLVVGTSTRWLLASVAYAEGVRHGLAGQMAEAHGDFQRSIALAPGLPLPAEAIAYAAIRLAGSEGDPARRRELLREAASLLVRSRQHAAGSAASWTLTAQIALAQAQAGDRGKFVESLDAFAVAARLRPDDPEVLAQWSWAWLESGDAARARQTAERALARDPREWLAWIVLARSARELGDLAEAERALGTARKLAPPEARRLLDTRTWKIHGG